MTGDPWADPATVAPTGVGTVYLLHFDRPYKHARHYIGWTDNLSARLAAHAAGHGARLLSVVHAAGIGWTLARTWPGGRARERQLKNQGGAARCCPQCGVRPRAVRRSP
jgi:predicted GIY-YIG superfamily endonuclease